MFGGCLQQLLLALLNHFLAGLSGSSRVPVRYICHRLWDVSEETVTTQQTEETEVLEFVLLYLIENEVFISVILYPGKGKG
jgi:hypothetical protein